MHIEIVSDKSTWSDALVALGEYDFTHTFDFHALSSWNNEGDPFAFIVREGDRPLGVWPVLKRKIDGTQDFDFTSVYGYAGPLVRAGVDSLRVVDLLIGAMRDSGAISLFSRMHPLFVEKLGEHIRGERLGDVIVIDVGVDDDTLAGYRGSHRREIVNALRKGVTVSIESGPSAISDFHEIYIATMRDLNARDYYFFSEKYLRNLELSTDFKCYFLFARLHGRNIAASMFVVSKSIMQYFLSGTVSEFRSYAPSKVIIAEAHKLAVSLGLDKLVLGGGVGAGQDPLFSFKRGFSPIVYPFHITRHIFDGERYAELCEGRGIDQNTTAFFPAYRAIL